jgi:hypothetical protein
VAPEVIVDGPRRRNDEAVWRLREESRLRVERGRAGGPTRCMLGTMLALLIFVALESRRMHWQEVAPIVAQARAEAACEMFARRQAEIEDVTRDRMASAFDAEERSRIGLHSAEELETARRFAREQGCEKTSSAPPPAATREVTQEWPSGYFCAAHRQDVEERALIRAQAREAKAAADAAAKD